MLPEQISVSQITSYLLCPRKYAFRYVYGYEPERKAVALAFGTSIHAALAWFNQQKMAGQEINPEILVSIFEADWEASLAEPLDFESLDEPRELLDLGRSLLPQFADRMKNVRPVAIEERFEVPLVDPETGQTLSPVPLVGVIDCRSADTLYEYKTAARQISGDDLKRHLQLSAYSYARRLQGDPPQRLCLVSLLKQKQPSVRVSLTERSVAEEAWFCRLASEVVEAIDASAFPPSPGWMCSGCEHTARCQQT